jgi:HD-GYP domain-containing protein (c-di-GMP phosphodiesterase class II)
MATAPLDPASLLPVAVSTIRVGEAFDFDLYLRDAASRPVLYRGQNFQIQQTDLAALERRGIQTLFILHSSLDLYERYLREQVLTDPKLNPAARFCAVKEANRSVFLAALKSSQVEPLMAVAFELAMELTNAICNEECTLNSLLSLLSHDYYTYTHVTNVGVYCLSLAKMLGISERPELISIAKGALLHDVGKRHIPAEILNKNGKLTEEEFRVVKLHPLTGFRELCRQPELTWAQLMMVYQHHEKLDGKGYPVGIGGDEIHFLGRLCAVADVYDALSSYRPYRRPMPGSQIRQFFHANVDKHFDRSLVDCWDAVLKQKGSTDELGNH